MIVVDNNYEINGVLYHRTVSDSNLMIKKIGTEEVYGEAIDVLNSTWEYEETDIPIEIVQDEQEDSSKETEFEKASMYMKRG